MDDRPPSLNADESKPSNLMTSSLEMGAFVYVLRCADGSYYVGSATGDDLSKRFDEHQMGAYPGYTFSRRPVTLVWNEHFERITDAIAVERKLKGWSRAKKEALIRGDWTSLKTLAKRRSGARTAKSIK
jgi:putative endonuclease